MKALIVLAALTLPANANGIDLLPHYANDAPKVERSHVIKVSNPKPKAKPRKRKAHAFRPAPPPVNTDSVTRCLAPVRVVGSQDIREGAAEDSAKRAWAEYVRWTHGEAFQDFANATDYQKRCSRSSIGEALGQYFHRCEITANPCRPGMTEGAQ